MATPLTIAGENFPSKAAATRRCQEILRAYPGAGSTQPGKPEGVTDPSHIAFLRGLLARHPERLDKEGVGVDSFTVRVNPDGTGGTRCFHVNRTDGTSIDFGIKACLDGDG